MTSQEKSDILSLIEYVQRGTLNDDLIEMERQCDKEHLWLVATRLVNWIFWEYCSSVPNIYSCNIAWKWDCVKALVVNNGPLFRFLEVAHGVIAWKPELSASEKEAICSFVATHYKPKVYGTDTYERMSE